MSTTSWQKLPRCSSPRDAGESLPRLLRTPRFPSRVLRRAAAAGIAALASTFAPSIAAAAPPSARLEVRGNEPTRSCPDEAALRDAVAARLGRDPFDVAARTRATVDYARTGGRWTADVAFTADDGRPLGRRSLASAAATCADLGESVALALAIALDPAGPLAEAAAPSAAPPPNAPPTPAPGPPDREEDPFAPLPAPEARPVDAPPPGTPLRGRLGIGPRAIFGAAPAPAAGLAVEVGLARGAFSLGAEGHLDLPASDGAGAAPASHARVGRTMGALVPCARLPIAARATFEGCAVAAIGSLSAEGVGVARPRRTETFFASIGARAALEWTFAPAIAALAHADLVAPLTRPSLTIDDRDVWVPPSVGVAMGARIRAYWP